MQSKSELKRLAMTEPMKLAESYFELQNGSEMLMKAMELRECPIWCKEERLCLLCVIRKTYREKFPEGEVSGE